MKVYLTGSTYFFQNLEGFKAKDTDKIILVNEAKGFHYTRQTSMNGTCIFEWKEMSANEFLRLHLNTKTPMRVVKFLNAEFCHDIGFTISHLKQLEAKFKELDNKHQYAKMIYDFYIENNDFVLTYEQKLIAFEEYKKEREKCNTKE